MELCKFMSKYNFLQRPACQIVCSAGLKNIKMPPNYDHIVLPEKRRLRFVDKVPTFMSGNMKVPRTHKNLDLLRGPEEVHNYLIHNQYGLVALKGGRMTFRHFEMVRFSIMRKLDTKKMFAVWRVDDPWLPVTKKGLGQRMGGGKGAVDHYVTPVRPGRIIIEIGGKGSYEEVLPYLRSIASRMPFETIPCNVQILEELKQEQEKEKTQNINPYTTEYLIKNNVGNCRRWMNKMDLKYFGKYL
uniref:Large ribosomal subunit protein uL16m n=1 Tax=Cacopsylla melanoneura TaxID=428564 RepID=A0A8D8W0Q4_9HEMI